MLKLALIDDEETALRILKEKLETLLADEEAAIRCFTSGMALQEDILKGSVYDAIFLDINLPDSNGIFLAVHLRQLIEKTLLIFVSSQDDAVYDSFAASPFRFLRKSRMDAELPQIVHDLLDELKKREPAVVLLEVRQAQYAIHPEEVLYIEANKKQQAIHLPDETLEVNYSLKDLEPLFLPHGFVKPHNSFLVNYRVISSIRKNDLHLDNGETLPISKHRLAELKEDYLRLISG